MLETPYLKITLIKSKFGRTKGHLGTVTGLGLKRIGHSVIRKNDAPTRGMVNAIFYLVAVEGAENAAE